MYNRPFIISLLILLSTIGSVTILTSRSVPVVVKTNLENLPMEIAGFKGTEDSLPKAVCEELNADKHLYRHYASADGRQVDLYIGYYGTAKGGRTPHNPYACLPGAGWVIVDSHIVTLQVEPYPNPLAVSYILARKGDTYQTVLHWYQSAATKVLATGIQQNIQRFLGKLIHNQNDGAFVRVSALSDSDRVEEAKRRVSAFSKELLCLLPGHWPIEQ
jgi:EpsI family protein